MPSEKDGTGTAYQPCHPCGSRFVVPSEKALATTWGMTLTDLPAFAVHTITSGTEAEAVAHLQARGRSCKPVLPCCGCQASTIWSTARTPAGDRRNLRVCGHAGRHRGPGGAHGGHVLPPHAWPQSMHAAREWVTMLALWSRGHLSGYGADTFQGPLVPHCRFQRWRTISVRVFGVVHVKDSVETHRPSLSRCKHGNELVGTMGVNSARSEENKGTSPDEARVLRSTRLHPRERNPCVSASNHPAFRHRPSACAPGDRHGRG